MKPEHEILKLSVEKKMLEQVVYWLDTDLKPVEGQWNYLCFQRGYILAAAAEPSVTTPAWLDLLTVRSNLFLSVLHSLEALKAHDEIRCWSCRGNEKGIKIFTVRHCREQML